jgi:O-antigen/teichoic acid export membrane protein
MEHNVKRRLLLGFISTWVSKLSTSIVQLVQVPVFLHFWSVPLYGEWMIVNSIPAYLSFSNIGFGSVAYNEMTISVAAGDRERALRVFQSCWWLIIVLCGCIGACFSVALYWLPIENSLHLHEMSAPDTKWIIFYLGCAVLMGQLEQLLGSAYTCVGRAPYGTFIKSCISLFAFAATMVAVALHCGARETALTLALSNLLGTVLLCLLVRFDIGWIEYGWRHARISEIRRLFTPAVAFMGFPIGNALNIQGSLIVVGYALGPLSVVVFGTARTVSRVALQCVQMVSITFWPELSAAYGSENWQLIRTLHRQACQFALFVSVAVVAIMLVLGPSFLNHWTMGRIPTSRLLLSILLLVVILNSLWSTSSTLALATNLHKGLSFYYVCGTGLSTVFCYILAKWVGLNGAAAALLVSELVMILYVLPNSLRLAGDTWPAFLRSLVEFPKVSQAKELLRSGWKIRK